MKTTKTRISKAESDALERIYVESPGPNGTGDLLVTDLALDSRLVKNRDASLVHFPAIHIRTIRSLENKGLIAGRFVGGNDAVHLTEKGFRIASLPMSSRRRRAAMIAATKTRTPEREESDEQIALATIYGKAPGRNASGVVARSELSTIQTETLETIRARGFIVHGFTRSGEFGVELTGRGFRAAFAIVRKRAVWADERERRIGTTPGELGIAAAKRDAALLGERDRLAGIFTPDDWSTAKTLAERYGLDDVRALLDYFEAINEED